MQRLLLELIKLRITAMSGYILTRRDENIIYRHAHDDIENLAKQIDEIAEKIYKERIYIRHGRQKPAMPLHPGYGPERKLQRGERYDRMGDSKRKDKTSD